MYRRRHRHHVMLGLGDGKSWANRSKCRLVRLMPGCSPSNPKSGHVRSADPLAGQSALASSLQERKVTDGRRTLFTLLWP